MKSLLLIITFLATLSAIGQETLISSKQLSDYEIQSFFTDSLKNKLQIEFPIYRVYEFNDKGGKHFIILTEHSYYPTDISLCNVNCHDRLQAFCFSYHNGQFNLVWDFIDFIVDNSNEFSLQFWTKYFKLDDYDSDGYIDPIIVYGPSSGHPPKDGETKILIYHNGKKRGIRNQNGASSEDYFTQVDTMYFQLPKPIQERVRTIVCSIMGNEHSDNSFLARIERERINNKADIVIVSGDDDDDNVSLSQINNVEQFSYISYNGDYYDARIINTGFGGSDMGFYEAAYCTLRDIGDESNPKLFSFYLGNFLRYGGAHFISNDKFQIFGFGYAYDIYGDIWTDVTVTVTLLNNNTISLSTEYAPY